MINTSYSLKLYFEPKSNTSLVQFTGNDGDRNDEDNDANDDDNDDQSIFICTHSCSK